MDIPWGELPDLTLLIRRSRVGDRDAEDRFLDVAYPHLRKAAIRVLGPMALDKTFTPSDLLHQVYLKRLRGWNGEFNNREHYLRIVTKAMKDELIDRARRSKAQKRTAPELTGGFPSASASSLSLECILSLERELKRLDDIEPRTAQVVRLRYYGGCSWEETAKAVEASVKMVRTDWEFAADWLRKRLGGKSS